MEIYQKLGLLSKIFAKLKSIKYFFIKRVQNTRCNTYKDLYHIK